MVTQHAVCLSLPRQCEHGHWHGMSAEGVADAVCVPGSVTGGVTLLKAWPLVFDSLKAWLTHGFPLWL